MMRGFWQLSWHEGNRDGWGIYEPEGDYDRVPFYEDRRVKRIVASLIRQKYGGHSEVVRMISQFVGPITPPRSMVASYNRSYSAQSFHCRDVC